MYEIKEGQSGMKLAAVPASFPKWHSLDSLGLPTVLGRRPLSHPSTAPIFTPPPLF